MTGLGLLLATLIQPTELPLRLDRDVVTIGGKQYGLMPAEYVADRNSAAADWRPGNALLIQQTLSHDKSGRLRHSVYRAAKKTLETYVDPKGESIVSFSFLADGTVLVQTQTGRSGDEPAPGKAIRRGAVPLDRLYRATNGQLVPIASPLISKIAVVGSQAVALVARDPKESPVRLFVYEGGRATVVDTGVSAGYAYLMSYPNHPVYVTTLEGSGESDYIRAPLLPATGKYPATYYEYIPGALGLKLCPPPMFGPPSRPRPLGYARSMILKVQIDGLYVDGDTDSEFPAAIVAGDATDGEFSIEGNFIKYRHGGHLFVRELRPITAEELETLRMQTESKRLVNIAKQIGTAMQIYLADNNDLYPGRDEKVADLLMPYIRNEQFMQGFVYTYEGGSAVGMKDPANTVLGYVQGKYGRALIYADSHSKWEPRKP